MEKNVEYVGGSMMRYLRIGRESTIAGALLSGSSSVCEECWHLRQTRLVCNLNSALPSSVT